MTEVGTVGRMAVQVRCGRGAVTGVRIASCFVCVFKTLQL